MKHFNASLLCSAALPALGLMRAPEVKEDDPAKLSAEVKGQVDELVKIVTEFRTKNDERLKQIEKKGEDAITKAEIEKINKAIDDAIAKVNGEVKSRVDELEAKANRIALGEGGGNGRKLTAEQVEYSKKFEDFFRYGNGEQKGTSEHRELRDLEKKAVSAHTESDPAGGFTVRPEMETAIDSTLKEISDMRRLASVRQIGTGSYKKLVNQHGASSGWVGERESRPQTLSPDLVELEYPVMELYAMPAATQTLLDDSFVNIDQWLVDEVELEFAQQEGLAFIAGDGNKKPRGLIGGYTPVANASYAWGAPGYLATGVSGNFAALNTGTGVSPADNLIDLIFALKAGYRNNSRFLLNRGTMGAIRKFKDGQGNYLVDLRLRDGALVETIFGYPVEDLPDMPAMGANSFSVAFGDFRRAYLIVDRVGVRVLRDPYTSKPYVLFYTTKRVGGGVQNFEAYKLLKFGTS